MYNKNIYVKLKDILRSKGWKEQTCGEIYLLDTLATNFYKENMIIHISFKDSTDEEELKRIREE